MTPPAAALLRKRFPATFIAPVAKRAPARLRRALAALAAVLAAACGPDAAGPGGGPASLRLTPGMAAVEEGGVLLLHAALVDGRGRELGGSEGVAWSSADPEVAPVSGDGRVSGRRPGTARIEARAAGLSATLEVVVRPVGGTLSGTVTLAGDFLALLFRAPRLLGAAPPALPMGARLPVLGANAGAPPEAYTPNTLVVTYRRSALAKSAAGPPLSRAAAAEAGGELRARLAARLGGGARVAAVAPPLGVARVVVDDPARLETVRAALLGDPGVARVEREALAYTAALPGGVVPDDPFFAPQLWHYRAVDLPRAWRITTGSPSVVVAVVDDGARFDHPDLASRWTTDGYDFVSAAPPAALCGGGTADAAGDGDGWDADPTIPAYYTLGNGCVSASEAGGHGVHVAGTIAAAGDDGYGVAGVAWGVRVRPVRVVGAAGGRAFDIAMGILYAAGLPVEVAPGRYVQVSTPARVINVSVVGVGGMNTYCPAVAAATAAGSLVVAAAGNAATGAPLYPAACAEALSVAAVGPGLQRASYSSYGSTVDLAAPGGELRWGGSAGVLSTLWNFAGNRPAAGFFQGTSMAAPHVAGIAALLLSHEPGLTPAELRERLTAHAVDLGAPGWDAEYGAGLVSAHAALAPPGAAPRAARARLYEATTGAPVAEAAVGGGTFRFTRIPLGSYVVGVGEEEAGDGLFGVAGAGLLPRRWGATGVVEVRVGEETMTPVEAGFPRETEPNDDAATAGRLPMGGYVIGERGRPDDVDVYAVTVPGGTYTFQTAGLLGGCGLAALEEDTELWVTAPGGEELGRSGDVDAARLDLCSRLTLALPAGTYHVRVRGVSASWMGRYVLEARAGS